MKSASGTKLYAAILVLIVLLTLSGEWYAQEQQLKASQHSWCAVLDTVPVPPAGAGANNPSRLAFTKFYDNVSRLKKQFGC